MGADYSTVVGLFQTPADAQLAVDRLRTSNLRVRDVSVVERDARRHDPALDYATAPFEYRQYTTEELGDETAGGLVLGGLVGGTLGTLAGLGALIIPGIGPVIAAGPLVGALIGGTTGAITGTLAGALIEAFEIPETHAEVYHRRISEGGTMVAVHADPEHAAAVRDVFRETKAERFEWPEGPEAAPANTRYYWV